MRLPEIILILVVLAVLSCIHMVLTQAGWRKREPVRRPKFALVTLGALFLQGGLASASSGGGAGLALVSFLAALIWCYYFGQRIYDMGVPKKTMLIMGALAFTFVPGVIALVSPSKDPS